MSELMKRYKKEQIEQLQKMQEKKELPHGNSFFSKALLLLGSDEWNNFLVGLNAILIIALSQFYFKGDFSYLPFHGMIVLAYLISGFIYSISHVGNFFSEHFITAFFLMTLFVLLKSMYVV